MYTASCSIYRRRDIGRSRSVEFLDLIVRMILLERNMKILLIANLLCSEFDPAEEREGAFLSSVIGKDIDTIDRGTQVSVRCSNKIHTSADKN